MFRRSCLMGLLTLAIPGLLVGCSLDPANCPICQPPSGGNSGPDPTDVPSGESGGPCLPDETCDDGLTCVDDTCVPEPTATTLLIFHNNTGPMCLAALRWMEDAQARYPALVVEEHLTTEPGKMDLLRQLEGTYSGSEGVSTTFGYLPIIFFEDRAFSGFNGEVQTALESLLALEDAELP